MQPTTTTDTTPDATPAPKKLRQLPKVWKPFRQIKLGEIFQFGGVSYRKDGCFFASNPRVTSCEDVPFPKLFWPWTKVRSSTLVRDALPGGKSSADIAVPKGPTS